MLYKYSPEYIQDGDHPEYAKQRIDNSQAYDALLKDITELSSVDSLCSNPYCDPNENFTILHVTLKKLNDKHTPYTFGRFIKYRHKTYKWIIYGIIKSIRYRDRLVHRRCYSIWYHQIHSTYRMLRGQLLNRELPLDHEWLFFFNKLSLDIKKDEIYAISSTSKGYLKSGSCFKKINQIEIERVGKFNLLGVTLDEQVNWEVHTDKLATRLSKYSGILNKLTLFASPHIVNSLF